MKRFVAVGSRSPHSWRLVALGPHAAPRPHARPAPAPTAKSRSCRRPAEHRAAKRFIIGVKCDAPPFGYIDVRGRQRRLRCRDRTLVLAVRVRRAEPRDVRVRADACT